MGETPEEVVSALRDLRDAGCEIVTITHTCGRRPAITVVERWVKPEEFVEHSAVAEELGFAG